MFLLICFKNSKPLREIDALLDILREARDEIRAEDVVREIFRRDGKRVDDGIDVVLEGLTERCIAYYFDILAVNARVHESFASEVIEKLLELAFLFPNDRRDDGNVVDPSLSFGKRGAQHFLKNTHHFLHDFIDRELRYLAAAGGTVRVTDTGV